MCTSQKVTGGIEPAWHVKQIRGITVHHSHVELHMIVSSERSEETKWLCQC